MRQTIFTWNIRHGGGSRLKSILKVLEENGKSDVVVLTEFRNNKNKTPIIKKLQELGYLHFISPDVGPKINTILIGSKSFFTHNFFEDLKKHFHRVVRVETKEIVIYGTYFPQKNEKKEVFEFLMKMCPLESKSTVILGDFNTGKHFLDEKGKSFYCSEYLNKFEELGFVDAWRYINGNSNEFSWFSNSGNGFRIDHCFTTKGLSIKNCSYNHTYRIKKVSDHSLMTLEL